MRDKIHLGGVIGSVHIAYTLYIFAHERVSAADQILSMNYKGLAMDWVNPSNHSSNTVQHSKNSDPGATSNLDRLLSATSAIAYKEKY